MKQRVLVGLAVLALVAACAKEEGGGGGGGDIPSDGKTHSINGMSAEDFYAQFLTKDIHYESKEGDFETDYTVSVGFQEESRSMSSRYNLYLRDDGTFSLLYREYRIDARGTYIALASAPKRLDGKMRIREGRLVLDGVGVATGLEYNGYQSLSLKMDRDLGRARLAGTEVYGFRRASMTFEQDLEEPMVNAGTNYEDLFKNGTVKDL